MTNGYSKVVFKEEGKVIRRSLYNNRDKIPEFTSLALCLGILRFTKIKTILMIPSVGNIFKKSHDVKSDKLNFSYIWYSMILPLWT